MNEQREQDDGSGDEIDNMAGEPRTSPVSQSLTQNTQGCEEQPREKRNFLRMLARPSRYFLAVVFSGPIESYL